MSEKTSRKFTYRDALVITVRDAHGTYTALAGSLGITASATGGEELAAERAALKAFTGLTPEGMEPPTGGQIQLKRMSLTPDTSPVVAAELAKSLANGFSVFEARWAPSSERIARVYDNFVIPASYDPFIGAAFGSALERYFHHHIETGGFLRAVLENDLTQAVQRMNPRDIEVLWALMQLLLEAAPSNAWGDKDKVAAWLKDGVQ